MTSRSIRSSLTVSSITLWMTFTGCRLHSEKWGTSSFHIIVHICIFSGKLHGVFVNFQLCKCLCWSSARVPAVSVHSWCWYPELVMCGVGSHICSDVSSVYLSVPSLSGGGLREGNAQSGSNIKYIKWERIGGGGGGRSEPHLPAWVLVAALCQDHCLSLCHCSHT